MPATALGTLVTYNPWTVGPTALLEDVAARFDELQLHHVSVVDAERRVIGMLSDTDLLRAKQTQRLVHAGGGAADTDDAPLVFARDVMTRRVVSIGREATAALALSLLLKNHIHALPVVERGRLVGLVTSRDFLREFSYGDLPQSRAAVSSLLLPTTPEPVDPETPLDEVLLAMQEAGVGCLAAAKDGCPLGVLSQRDIVREKYRAGDGQGEFRPAQTVQHVIRNSPLIRPGQRLCEAASAMIDERLPAVTVVNQSGRLLGLVTEDDLLRVLYDAQV
jgi:CBS domain-containing protein